MKATEKNFLIMLAESKKSVFLPPISQAEVAQLVEHNLAKVGVASSSLVFRSNAVETSQCGVSTCFYNSVFYKFSIGPMAHLLPDSLEVRCGMFAKRADEVVG